ncbi:conserved hypothetical protein [Parvibaculum lavamentivorans DS-1]|uniref:Lipoprotein n=1 Tax=Parvibaculum lavamentivorans (strain DS-1 / DSM 13023 / NCIMB 13966) TaxID=402881 RepID=A7HQ45_PARL1|nr:hypothetical protein [Parvibaculum lavamentivorans]ABS62028.1 conserved hypothetical protein [Parvibaculum lavamentivorans DS-1]
MNLVEKSAFSMLRRLGAVVFLGLLAAACAGDPPPPPASANVSFEARSAFQIPVAFVAVDSYFTPSGRAPYVEHLHKVSPESIARAWARARLVATGGPGTASLAILDGTVISEQLDKKGGLTGVFGDQLDTRLKARLKARLTVERPDAEGNPASWMAEVDATAERTILESASLNERDAAYAALMQSLAEKFDAALTAEVERSMRPVLR